MTGPVTLVLYTVNGKHCNFGPYDMTENCWTVTVCFFPTKNNSDGANVSPHVAC